MPCCKLRLICRKHSNDVARQVETPDKSAVFVARQICFVTRHEFHVTLEDTLYNDCKQVDAAMDAFLV